MQSKEWEPELGSLLGVRLPLGPCTPVNKPKSTGLEVLVTDNSEFQQIQAFTHSFSLEILNKNGNNSTQILDIRKIRGRGQKGG